jgi:hypothetical protein
VREPVAAALNNQRGPWKIDTDFTDDAIHIRPRADLWWHPLEVDCWCGPAETAPATSDGGVVLTYVHNAADGRE